MVSDPVDGFNLPFTRQIARSGARESTLVGHANEQRDRRRGRLKEPSQTTSGSSSWTVPFARQARAESLAKCFEQSKTEVVVVRILRLQVVEELREANPAFALAPQRWSREGDSNS
jgi:hypothetical protein